MVRRPRTTKGRSGLWLDRYTKVSPIRTHGALSLVSAVRAEDAERRVVLVGSSAEADPARTAEALAEIERVHALLDHPVIPKVSARGVVRRAPFLELDCDASVDGVDLHRVLSRAVQRIPLSTVIEFVTDLFEAMHAAHATVDPQSGKRVCLGRLSHANLLFSASGRFFLVGYGRNFPVEMGDGGLDGGATVFQAPEVALGEEPSPLSDYVALLSWMKSFFGETGGGAPDREGFASHVADLLRRAGAPPASERGRSSGSPSVVLGGEVSWVQAPSGVRLPLGHALRHIVTALADLHRRAPGAVLTLADLFEIGWPGERLTPESKANRVYVALAQLRQMGMRNILEHHTGGYRFAPHAVIRCVSPPYAWGRACEGCSQGPAGL